MVERALREVLRRGEVALELKKLQSKALSFRANIEAISREYDAGNELAAEHVVDLKGLRGDLTEMRDDLRATVDITKNSIAASNDGEATGEKKVEATGEKQTISSQEVGQLPGSTFQAEGH
jgi:hypothetical protein